MSRGWILTVGIPLLLGLAACALGSTAAVVGGVTPSPQLPISASPLPSISASLRPRVSPSPRLPVTESPPPHVSPSPRPRVSPSPRLSLPPSPTPEACLLEGGRVLRDWQSTHLLPQPLQYRVYLPPCYDEHAHRRYPVLYLIHGQSYTDDQWDRLGADETASALIVSGEVLPFIIVMPRDMVWTQPSEDGFGEALVQVLIPTIEEEYRTLPGREFRAIGGLSRGASWAIHLGLSRWQLFSAIGAHSPPVFWEDIHSIALWLEVIPAEALPRIYMDIGEDDRPEVMDSAVWFEGVLTSKGLPHEWHLFQGEHDEDYWKAHVEQYLRWYAGGW